MARPVKIRGLYYYRQRVPADVAPKLGKKFVKESLGTGREAEARLAFPPVAAKWQAFFEQVRRGVQTLTPEQCEGIAGEIYADLIRTDGGDQVALAPFGTLYWKGLIHASNTALKDEVDLGPDGVVPGRVYLEQLHGPRLDRHLAARGMTVCERTYYTLLYAVNRAIIQASEVVVRQAFGDYTPDPNASRFPKTVLPDPSKTFKALWKEYCKSKKASDEVANKKLHFFDAMIEHAGTDDMRLITEEHLLGLRDKLQASGLMRKTVKEGYFAHIKAFFAWAKRQKKLPTNPAAEVVVEMADDGKDMRGLTDAETRAILRAALGPFGPRMAPENRAARRWVPWLCAYTGARLNEITQLRPTDVKQIDGVWCIEITPDAGSLKNEWSARLVPLHPRLTDGGFLDFVDARRSKARLFYDEERAGSTAAARNLGNKLREWVKGMGVLEDDLAAPFHGWRHRFRTVGRDCGIDEVKLSAIQGHAPDTEGKKYGKFKPGVLFREIKKLKRCLVEGIEPGQSPPAVDRARSLETTASAPNDSGHGRLGRRRLRPSAAAANVGAGSPVGVRGAAKRARASASGVEAEAD